MRGGSHLKVSVVIISYNTKELLLRCIETVLHELKAFDGEVLVVDNASSDFSADAVERKYSMCRLIRNQVNLGFGKANNQAFRLASGEYVLLLNPDTELLEGALGKLISYLDKHADVGVVGPRTFYPDRSIQPSAFAIPNLLTEFLLATFLYLILCRIPAIATKLGLEWSPDTIQEVGYMQGSCLLCRNTVLQDVKGFDERYFLFTEELDLQYRIGLERWKLVFYPDAEIIHHHGKAMEQNPESTFVELFASKAQFIEKYHSKWYLLSTKILWALYHFLRIMVFTPILVINNSEKWRIKVRKHRAVLRYLLSRNTRLDPGGPNGL